MRTALDHCLKRWLHNAHPSYHNVVGTAKIGCSSNVYTACCTFVARVRQNRNHDVTVYSNADQVQFLSPPRSCVSKDIEAPRRDRQFPVVAMLAANWQPTTCCLKWAGQSISWQIKKNGEYWWQVASAGLNFRHQTSQSADELHPRRLGLPQRYLQEALYIHLLN